jgi:transcriptional regulator with XRE-family HTH domain
MASRSTRKSLGAQIKEARIAAGHTLRGLARDLKLSPSYLNDIEYDRRTPSDDVVRQLALFLELDVDALLAAAGKVGIGKDAEEYIKATPSAGVLFRRVANDRLPEDQLKQLLERIDQMNRDNQRG